MTKAALLLIVGTVGRIFQATSHGSVNDAGLDDGDPHVEGLHLLCKRFAERLQGELRRGVGCEWRCGNASRDRGYVDDASGFALAHLWHYRLYAADRTKVISLHHCAEFREGQLLY